MRVLARKSDVLLLAATLMLTACATGTPFTRPPADAIQLGKTTVDQVIERLGKPGRDEMVRSDKGQFRTIVYTRSDDTEATQVPRTLGIRQLAFVLSDDVVISERFDSSFASDSTDFDDRKVGQVVEGKTRCDDVVEMFGRPAARAIYPAVKKEGETYIGYMFRYIKRPVHQFKMFGKGLSVLCDQAGIVKEMSYSESGDR
jgi:hypothetical protein